MRLLVAGSHQQAALEHQRPLRRLVVDVVAAHAPATVVIRVTGVDRGRTSWMTPR
jgi:hypothetical protein